MMLVREGRRILPFFLLSASLPAFFADLPSHAAVAPAPRVKPAIGAASALPEQRVRVRILEAVARVRVRGFDLVLSGGAYGTPSYKRRRVDRASEWELHCQSGRIRATRVDGTGGIGEGRALELPEPATIVSPVGFLTVHGKSYRETLRIHSEGSLCEAVNEIELEKYLSGLVNAEFNSRWSAEAVGAQVVAARTYALFKMGEARRNPSQHFDLDSTVRDQVYDGSVKEDARAARVVERTRGLVLTSDGNRPLKAFYHSTCGGRTELPQKVWGSPFPGFRKTVPCPFCSVSPAYHWGLSFSTAEIARSLLNGARADGVPPGWPSAWARILSAASLEDLQTEQKDPDGRVERVTSVWKLGGARYELPLKASRFRDWVGAARLKSAKFVIRRLASIGSSATWKLEGRGNGHGVGMCQWGAKVMGDRGYTTATILRHYYPDSILRKMW